MKEEISTADHNKVSSHVFTGRARASRTKESQGRDSANGVSSAGLKSRPMRIELPSDASNTIKGSRISTQLNKVRLPANDVGSPKERDHKDSKFTAPLRNRVVEQYARLQRKTDTNCKVSQDEANLKTQELQNRLDESEGAVRQLQSEVVSLRSQLEKLQGLNDHLELQNKKLQEDLEAADVKITALERHHQESSVREQIQQSTFGDVQKLIQRKLQRNKVKELQGVEAIVLMNHSLPTKTPNDSAILRAENSTKQPKLSLPNSHGSLAPPPPPPPPPPPRQSAGKVNSGDKEASALVELYHSLAKRNGKKEIMNNTGSASVLAKNAQNSIVGELQNRSAHLLAIKADVETKGQLIKYLIGKVRSVSCTNAEDVLAFVDWLDGELNTLVDETAVLKHFDWPEKKVDALREAAFEYRNLKQLETEVSSYKDDSSLTCENTLKKVSHLFDKLERSMSRLMKLRNDTMLSYRDYKIPTDWMLDSGMVSKMKVASMRLAKVYMRKVSMELKSGRHSERESAQEALLVQAVRFAYRAHQFAGGLDSETMSAFEELKRRMQLETSAN